MYRKPSSTGVLSGVPSGPYTGGKRILDAALLDATTRERLDKALSGRSAATPIAYERAVAGSGSRQVWGVIAATMGLAVLFAIGFGNLESTWAVQPWRALVLYLGLGYGFARGLLPLLQRRVLYGGGKAGALRPGRYLFPLDAVAIDLPDAAGNQLVTVRPLGDARDANVAIDGKRVEIVVVFEGGESLRFPLRGDHKGTVALRRLEHAQRLIEDLTYKQQLEQSFTNDIFFDVRVDGSWDKLAPGKSSAPVRAPNLASLALGRFAPVVLAVVTLGLGGGTFFARRAAGDVALFNHALAAGTPEAMERYVDRGGARTLVALDVRQRLLDARKPPAPKSAGQLEVPEAFLYPTEPEREACFNAIAAHASKQHPAANLALLRALRGLTHTFVFDTLERRAEYPSSLKAGDVPDLTDALDAASGAVVHALEAALWTWCPKNLPRTKRLGPQLHPDRAPVPILKIETRAIWTGAVWPETGTNGEPFPIHELEVVFKATLVEDGRTIDAFTLTMPPPPNPFMETRPKSLFRLPGGPFTVPTRFDERVYYAMTARAYDRLYDEVWSLFFEGDPIVQLGEQAPLP